MEKYIFTKEKKEFLERAQIPFAIYQFVDKHVVTLVLSKGFCDLFGYDRYEDAYYDMDNEMYKDVHPNDIIRIEEAALRFATKGGEYDVIYRSKRKEGDGYNIVHAIGRHYLTDTNQQLAQVWYTNEGIYGQPSIKQSDLSKSLIKALEDESYIFENNYDYLTGLPSMNYFFELAERHKERSLKENKEPIILFFDFSGMRYYNSRYGFEEGNKLLKKFGKILISFFGDSRCSRFGQDHFAAVTELNDKLEETIKDIISKAEKLNETEPLPLRVGIYTNSMGDVSASIACDRAKLACNSLRNTYISGFSYFDQKINKKLQLEQYIINNIDKAINSNWIQVYYQPIYRAINKKICCEEALARWLDPELGMLSPGEFVPVLERIRMIYKLDLFVVDKVLEKMLIYEERGIQVIPQSINLSRSDFETCDIVEEIRKRVDRYGISHDLLIIEITESIVGSDFSFIKTQIERFHELGFPVWMDDFGSGYSSLNALQNIKFNLIKFDMRFLENINHNESDRVLLSELIKITSLLGFDTLCEGVENEEQVKFLQEVGCSKLQGYYFSKPNPLETILDVFEKTKDVGIEDTSQLDYFEAVGRANLNDVSTVSREDYTFQNFYKTVPMAIIEVKDNKIRYTRTNRSFKRFMMRSYQIDLTKAEFSFNNESDSITSSLYNMVMEASKTPIKSFIDMTLPDKAVGHFLIRRFAENKKSGYIAVVLAVLSVSKADEGASYAAIARALSTDYYNIFYVDLNTDTFIEYNSEVGEDRISEERHGKHFFDEAREVATKRLYYKDRKDFLKAFTKENIINSIKENGTFTINYRLLSNKGPLYVGMKAMTMPDDPDHIIFGVNNVDNQMKQQEEMNRISQDRITYNRIMALNGDFICLYVVDYETGAYREYTSSKSYEEYGLAKSGKNFYIQGVIDALNVVPKDDIEYFKNNFTKEKIQEKIKKDNLFTMTYHLMIDEEKTQVILKAVLVNEDDGDKLIVGVNKIEK